MTVLFHFQNVLIQLLKIDKNIKREDLRLIKTPQVFLKKKITHLT